VLLSRVAAGAASKVFGSASLVSMSVPVPRIASGKLRISMKWYNFYTNAVKYIQIFKIWSQCPTLTMDVTVSRLVLTYRHLKKIYEKLTMPRGMPINSVQFTSKLLYMYILNKDLLHICFLFFDFSHLSDKQSSFIFVTQLLSKNSIIFLIVYPLLNSKSHFS
jgi:hypothetical protein